MEEWGKRSLYRVANAFSILRAKEQYRKKKKLGKPNWDPLVQRVVGLKIVFRSNLHGRIVKNCLHKILEVRLFIRYLEEKDVMASLEDLAPLNENMTLRPEQKWLRAESDEFPRQQSRRNPQRPRSTF